MIRQSKIGILTFHRCINYGSYWQARCLVEGLRARGREAELLDHQSHRVNRAEWRCALQPVLPTPVPSSDRPQYAAKMRTFFRDFAALPLSPPFDLDRPEEMPDYDVVMVGSDEVWNLSHPWYGCCPLFYGTGLRAQRLISYAASFGNYSAWWGLPQHWSDPLRKFDAISVRDENSRALIVNELGVEPAMALDPCLQFPPAPVQDGAGDHNPYLAVYGHNFSERFSSEARRWAASRGCPVVSIGYRNDWADEQRLTAGPREFARFISGAAAVATNFFHGCVFSLVNARPFVCETTSYRSFKVLDLLSLLGAASHLMTETSSTADYFAGLDAPPVDEIFQRLHLLRRQTDDFLNQALAAPRRQLA